MDPPVGVGAGPALAALGVDALSVASGAPPLALTKRRARKNRGPVLELPRIRPHPFDAVQCRIGRPPNAYKNECASYFPLGPCPRSVRHVLAHAEAIRTYAEAFTNLVRGAMDLEPSERAAVLRAIAW